MNKQSKINKKLMKARGLQAEKENEKGKSNTRSKKGFFITMDAAIGLLVVVLIISTSITLVELTHQKSIKELTRQARNLYEYTYLGGATSPSYIKVDCASSTSKVSIDSFEYEAATNSIIKVTTTVCE